MDVGSSVYASFLRSAQSISTVGEARRDESIAFWEPQSDVSKTSSSHSAAVMGVSSSSLSAQTMSQLIQETQSVHEQSSKLALSSEDTFLQNNSWSQSDQKLLEAMTGYTVKDGWQFADENGVPGFPEDLTQHTMRSFMMDLRAARMGFPADAIKGEDITISEFTDLMKNAQAVAASMGENPNDDFLVKGLAYLRERDAGQTA